MITEDAENAEDAEQESSAAFMVRFRESPAGDPGGFPISASFAFSASSAVPIAISRLNAPRGAHRESRDMAEVRRAM
jgi:hypothetical protein